MQQSQTQRATHFNFFPILFNVEFRVKLKRARARTSCILYIAAHIRSRNKSETITNGIRLITNPMNITRYISTPKKKNDERRRFNMKFEKLV